MISLISGAAAGIVVLLGCRALLPPAPPRLPLLPERATARTGDVSGAVGRRLKALLRLEDSPLSDSAFTATAAAVAGSALLIPPLPVLLIACLHVHARLARVAAIRRSSRDLATAMPECVDLLLLCTGAGMSLPLALPVVAERTSDPLGSALRASELACSLGSPRADALAAALTPLGERAAALGHVLAEHLRYGVPLAPSLERLGLEVRIERRRKAEEEARRVPVRMLGPLVTCVLPAFGLLTIVPLLAASLRALPR